MSTTSRARKSSPVKQGPMRATIPMASLLRHSTGLRKSPTLSPTSTWKSRTSPESSSSGQRSPGSITYKVNSRTLAGGDSCVGGGGSVIRRTASLDTIYLKGQWPRDSFYLHSGLLQVDKATQTEDPFKVHRINSESNSSSVNDDILEKLFRQRLQRSSKDSNSNNSSSATNASGANTVSRDRDRGERITAFGLVHQTSTECSSQTLGSSMPSYLLPSPTTKASPVNIPTVKPMAKPPMRSSIEGLNQEIERLVLKGGLHLGTSNSTDRGDIDKFQKVTPEGHRAPLADLLRSTRSVNTQTPAASDITGSCQSSGPPSRDSVSPLIPGQLDVSRPPSEQGSQGSSPDQEGSRFGTSPHINRFLAREPPDGCERVSLRFRGGGSCAPGDGGNDAASDATATALKPCVTFQLRPSLGSAFQPLQPAIYATENAAVNEIKPSLGSAFYPLQTLSDEGSGVDELNAEATAMPIVPQQDIM